MRDTKRGIDRRQVLQTLGLAGTSIALGCGPGGLIGGYRREIERRVWATPIVDTHEHLADEVDRLAGRALPCDDWSVLLYDYVALDLLAAGMPQDDHDALFSADVDPIHKWQVLEPFWPKVMNTGFAQAVRLSMQELYGIDNLEARVIPRLQSAYEEFRQPGFYEKVLTDIANIESCQVNTQKLPFHKSRQPTLLMQDLSFLKLYIDPDIEGLSEAAGVQVKALEDWHGVIRWWFENYARFAVAAKSQGAYLRSLNHFRVEPEKAAPIFDRLLAGERIPNVKIKMLEDHLFWYCVDQATLNQLPVKIHTGYQAKSGGSQFRFITDHPRDIIEMCRRSLATRFVFLHIAYPYWQELIAIAKQFPNAYVDMSWSWITDPTSARDFLKRYLVTAPSNKVFTFGGDYAVLECVPGHAQMARRGISLALSELVDEGWLGRGEAVDLVDPLLRGNAREVFRLAEKTVTLKHAPWIGSTTRS